MAKSSKAKSKGSSLHSRAARRAASPPNKTVTDLSREASQSRPQKQLPVPHYGGVSKKKSKTKSLSRAQRLRRQKGMERAEAVLDQLEVKKLHSAGRSKKINARRAAWDDHNSKMPSKRQPTYSVQPDDDEWEDIDDDEVDARMEEEQEVLEGVKALHVSSVVSPNAGPADGIKAINLNKEDEDEIL